ncbi:hypothetical protein ACTNEF_15120 [Bariatricus sp. HCP28S3_E4]|uniref:hypothetical protein n=1 Tax=unclassified Bariatricus TaxID=2677046 RepID=UPI003F8C5A06
MAKAQTQNKVKQINKVSACTIRGKKKREKNVFVELNTMMPNSYPASRRAQLKDFEKRVMSR